MYLFIYLFYFINTVEYFVNRELSMTELNQSSCLKVGSTVSMSLNEAIVNG